MMWPDTFEINATIKALEKDRNRTVLAAFVALGALSWWFAESFTKAESMIFGAVCFIGILLFQEVRNAHIQSLRVSLRHIALMRNPALLHEED